MSAEYPWVVETDVYEKRLEMVRHSILERLFAESLQVRDDRMTLSNEVWSVTARSFIDLIDAFYVHSWIKWTVYVLENVNISERNMRWDTETRL